MKNPILLLLALLGTGGLREAASAPRTDQPDNRTTAPKAPNILLILADDVGREAIGAWGGESCPTPEIDKLAAGGLRFSHFYTATVCHPTRVTLMSGRYPWKTGNEKWGWYNPGFEKETIAHELKKAGYATAIAGKWQLMLLKKDPLQPRRMGFDESCLFGWHEGPRYWDPLIYENGELHDHPTDVYGPDVYTDFLIDFMKRNRDGRFFAYYPMSLCHAVSDDFMPRPAYGPGKDRYENFAEMVAAMDKYVGKLIRALEDLGLRERTLVFFTTDNGSPGSVFQRHAGKAFESHDVVSKWRGHDIPGQKGEFTDWGTRAPTVANWPGTIAPGASTDALVDLSDLLPTFVDVAGGDAPAFPLDGGSFAALLTGGEQDHPREWVCTPSRQGIFAVRTRDWKLTTGDKLYDMRNDPVVEKPIPPAQDTPDSRAARIRLEEILGDLAK